MGTKSSIPFYLEDVKMANGTSYGADSTDLTLESHLIVIDD